MFRALFGGGPDAATKRKHEELLRVVKENDVSPLQLFLHSSTTPEEVRNKEKRTLLHVAAMEGSTEALALLLQSPKMLRKVDSRDRTKMTALHLAAAMGRSECARSLLDANAAIDSRDSTGNTPLHLAIKFQWALTAKLLLAFGADPLLQDCNGANAMDMANASRDFDTGELFATDLDGVEDIFAAGKSPRGAAPQSGNTPRAALQPKSQNQPAPSIVGNSALLQSTPSKAPAGLGLEQISVEDSPNFGMRNGGAHTDVRASPLADVISEAADDRRDSTGTAKQRGKSKEAKGGKKKKNSSASSEAVSFCVAATFDASAARLEFDVEWIDPEPRVGEVNEGGAAHQRGIMKGDIITEIRGTPTSGRSRADLLPLLKARPLYMKLRRALPLDEAYVGDLLQPRLELKLCLQARQAGSSCSLCENIEVIGELPVVLAVNLGSPEIAAGVLEGDAILEANGQDMRGLGRADLRSVLSERPLRLTVWRLQVGADLFAPRIAPPRM
eukprot:TRINITY_DN104196_c0_g1_i1.p1 TRINITY_DN104196_c0_g1~~TRINITY_DN104196_c0_g1_i1.p1  ORF type:complete len:501 (-),score=112.36 TRINITY_DN104196_c0_g1_i1:59-1561(-)